MPTLNVAHDYICPWCWVAWQQSRRLYREFPTLTLHWLGYELLPEGLEYTPTKPDPNAPKKPSVPSRFELLLYADGLTLPKRTRDLSNSRRALEGAEYAKEVGKEDEYHDAVYHAYWEEDRDIHDLAVLTEIAEAAGLDTGKFLLALETRRFRDRIVEYDDPAHEAGVWNVPTWMFPEGWIAEQPYVVVHEYMTRFLKSE